MAMTNPPSPPDPLAEPLAKGVLRGAAATKLEKVLGTVTVGDLRRYYPRRYQDLATLTPIAELAVGEAVTILAEVERASLRQMRSRRGSILSAVVTDGRDKLELTFFQGNKMRHLVKEGQRLLCSGTVDMYRGKKQLTHPEVIEFGGDVLDAAAEVGRPMP